MVGIITESAALCIPSISSCLKGMDGLIRAIAH